MFEIKKGVIKITRGDAVSLRVNLRNRTTATEYTMQENDTLIMTVRKSAKSDVLMQVRSSTEVLYISSNDSKKLTVGSCVYDIELKTASGEVFTVVGLDDSGNKNMIVYAEVTE